MSNNGAFVTVPYNIVKHIGTLEDRTQQTYCDQN